MVDVTAAPEAGGSFMGRTRGALRSMRSVLGGGGEYLQGLGNRLGTALSSSLEESDPTTSPSTQTSQTQPGQAAAQARPPLPLGPVGPTPGKDELDARRKLRFPK